MYTNAVNQDATFQITETKLYVPVVILNLLVEASFQGLNRLFVLAFENNTQRTSNKYIISQVYK